RASRTVLVDRPLPSCRTRLRGWSLWPSKRERAQYRIRSVQRCERDRPHTAERYSAHGAQSWRVDMTRSAVDRVVSEPEPAQPEPDRPEPAPTTGWSGLVRPRVETAWK